MLSEPNILGMPIDIVLLLEVSKHVDINVVKSIGKELIKSFRENELSRVGLIAFSSRSLPLMDLTPEKKRVMDLIEKVPELEGPPDLVKGLKESVEMLRDFSDRITFLKLIIVVCSCSTRFQRHLRTLLLNLQTFNIDPVFVVLQTKPPSWLLSIVEKDRVIPVRWNTGPERVALRVLKTVSNLASRKLQGNNKR